MATVMQDQMSTKLAFVQQLASLICMIDRQNQKHLALLVCKHVNT